MSLEIFLLGTLDINSPLSILRGQTDILRLIFNIACEEWWELHIERMRDLKNDHNNNNNSLPNLTLPWSESDDSSYPIERQTYGGFPSATIAKNITFPPITSVPMNTFHNQQDDILFINMMPFHLKKKESLPLCCRQYWPLIQTCLRRDRRNRGNVVGYLSIDERPITVGNTHRRGGLHVESPGVLPILGIENKIEFGKFVPGIEHNWGNGLFLRDESFEGGIYLGSNIANTTAVWNCKIRDDHGDIIGPHGSIERLRHLLGPPTKTLEAGEIVWLTDRTPHESLPILQSFSNSLPPRRQFFRLVLGEVTAWFADHCTPNPTGFSVPSSVRVVHGNKYELFNSSLCKILWITGLNQQIEKVKKENELRQLCFTHDIGHMADILVAFGFCSLEDFVCEAIKIDQIKSKTNKSLYSIIDQRGRKNYPELIDVYGIGHDYQKFVKIISLALIAIRDTRSSINDEPEFDKICTHFRNLIILGETVPEYDDYFY